MIKGTTNTGFEYEIADDVIDDYELLEIFSELDKNPILLPTAVKKILGEEQKNRLLDHIRDKDGRAKMSAMEKEIINIFTSKKELKN